MSIERDVVGGSDPSLSAEDRDASNKEALRIANEGRKQLISDKHGHLNQDDLMGMSDEQLLNRFVEIADRGFTSFRLKVPVDPGWYGEWAPNDPASIAEYQMKGFIVDDKFAVNHGLHSDATGKPIVGDVIHMICPTRIKDFHDRAAKLRFDRVHGRRTNLPEETNFNSQMDGLGLETKYKDKNINTSSQQAVSQSQILNAVKGS